MYFLRNYYNFEVHFLVHRIESIVIPCINSDSNVLIAQGALILGSAASNNQKVQVAALQAGVIPLLLKHISEDYEFPVNFRTINLFDFDFVCIPVDNFF